MTADTLTHTLSFQADRSTIKHTAIQTVLRALRQAEPRAVLQGPSPPHTSVIPLVGGCLAGGFDVAAVAAVVAAAGSASQSSFFSPSRRQLASRTLE